MISVSRYTRRRLLALVDASVLDPDRVHVVPNAVNAEAYVAPREVGPSPWHALRFTLGIGEVKERKGHHLAVEAWARIAAASEPDLHHVIVGKGGDDAYGRSLREVAARHGVEDRLHLVGNVTEDEKVDLLQRAEVFLHTPITASDGGFEGFGIVYLEAAAARTAAIGTLDSGAEDAIVDGETGFLVAQDADAVEEALARVLGDDVLRDRLAAGGRAHAEASSWEDNARRVLRIYGDALDARGGRR